MALQFDTQGITAEMPKDASADAGTGKEGHPRKPKQPPTVADPMLGIGTGHCRCYQCGEYFNSVAAFDKHQGIDKGRVICTHPLDILARDGTPKPMVKNDRGYWVLSLMGDQKFFERPGEEEA